MAISTQRIAESKNIEIQVIQKNPLVMRDVARRSAVLPIECTIKLGTRIGREIHTNPNGLAFINADCWFLIGMSFEKQKWSYKQTNYEFIATNTLEYYACIKNLGQPKFILNAFTIEHLNKVIEDYIKKLVV